MLFSFLYFKLYFKLLKGETYSPTIPPLLHVNTCPFPGASAFPAVLGTQMTYIPREPVGHAASIRFPLTFHHATALVLITH